MTPMAATQPHASYAVLTKGVTSKWTYHLRCSPCSPDTLASLDNVIDEHLLPTLTGGGVRHKGAERELLSFPTRFGGLAIPVLEQSAPAELAASLAVTVPLVQLLLTGMYEGSKSPSQPLPTELLDGSSSGHQPAPSEFALGFSAPDPVQASSGPNQPLLTTLPADARGAVDSAPAPHLSDVQSADSMSQRPAGPSSSNQPMPVTQLADARAVVSDSVPALPLSDAQSAAPLSDAQSAAPPLSDAQSVDPMSQRPAGSSSSVVPHAAVVSDTSAVAPCDSPVRMAVSDVRHFARTAKSEKLQRVVHRQQEIREDLSAGQRFLLEIASEKGVSSWLTVSPSWSTGTVMSKVDFRGAVCIRYGRPLPDTPGNCVCGAELTSSHALTCPSGGYTIARHNDVRDLVAGLIREAGVVDVETEPWLLPCGDSAIPGGRSTNLLDEARLDVRARGFWSRQQDAFFDVRITHPAASVRSRSEALSQLRAHERPEEE